MIDSNEPPPRLRRVFRRLSWGISVTPLLFVVIQMLHAIHIRILLGRWPVVYRDNPESVLLKIHEYGLLFPVVYAAIFGVPLWAALSLLVTVLLPSARWTIARQAGLVGVGVAALVLFWKFDPTGYVEWFLD